MTDWINDIGSASADFVRDHGKELLVVAGAGWFWQLLARAAEVRRDGYATAMRTLVEFQEFPYRIRRRTSDDAAVRAELAGRGHDMQEKLAYWQLWADTEHRVMGDVFREASRDVRGCIRPYVVDAWNQPFIDGPEAMIIATPDQPIPYDLSACGEPLRRLRKATAWRFGWRRLLSPIWLPLVYGSAFGLKPLFVRLRRGRKPGLPEEPVGRPQEV